MSDSTTGWIKISREIVEMKGYFKEKFCYPMCWIDLLLLAEWRDERVFYIRGIEVVLKRGQVAMSIRDLAERWSMSINTVQAVIKKLEDEERIKVKSSKVINIITILNYDMYQNIPEPVCEQSVELNNERSRFFDTQKSEAKITKSTTCEDSLNIFDTQTDTQTDTLSIRNIRIYNNINTSSISEKAQNPILEKEKSCVQKEKEPDDSFEEFWVLYDKKIEKDKCKKKWQKLKSSDKAKIFETLPEYINSTPNKQYRKNPATYLNQQSWNDEIINNSYGNRGNQQQKINGAADVLPEDTTEQSYFDTLSD